jgi:hypothetical protein
MKPSFALAIAMITRPTIGQFKANQCINFSLTHWANSSTRQSYDKPVLCANDIPKVSHTGLRAVWPQFGTSGDNTGQLRTIGPVPPSVPYPSDGASQKFLERGGVFFLGAVLSGLGSGWNYVGDKRRVWVVKVGDLVPSSEQQTSSPDTSGAGAAVASGRGQAVAKTLRAENFTGEHFSKIAQGMSFEAVQQIIGREPDGDFTRRSDDGVMYKWAATINIVLAAKSIDVFFDAIGNKVKGSVPGVKIWV